MKIDLKDFRIESDTMQFIVSAKGVIQAGKLTKAENVGKDKWDIIGYCSTVKSCMALITRNIVLVNDDLDTIMKKLEGIEIIAKGIDKKLKL